jgi:N-acetylglucosaminyldiphosphoundecaprenol N-acetyl-beta-D-mannosaminyltransferase
MLRLSDLQLVESKEELGFLPRGKVLINTINAHSYNVAQKDEVFAESINVNVNVKEDERCWKYLIPDGASIVKACRWLKGKSQPKERIAGWDLFEFEMSHLNSKMRELKNEKMNKWRVMFMGSSEKVLSLIRTRAEKDYPNLEIVTYSPPYKEEFSDEDNAAIITAINEAKPDLLWIGMTAPKQEKWVYRHWNELDIDCHVGTIGAVFDFYAGTVERAPLWMQRHGLEWLYRLVRQPRKMWKRYLVGNPLFLYNVIKEYFQRREESGERRVVIYKT